MDWGLLRKAVTIVGCPTHYRNTVYGTHLTEERYEKSQSSTTLNMIVQALLFPKYKRNRKKKYTKKEKLS